MNKRIKISLILIYIVIGVAFLFAGLYLFSPTIMPYHERFLGLSHSTLNPKVASLMLDLMGVGGSGFLTYGVILLFFARYFKHGSLIAWKGILYSSLAILCPLLYFTLAVGLYSPWWIVGTSLALILTALKISRPMMN